MYLLARYKPDKVLLPEARDQRPRLLAEEVKFERQKSEEKRNF